MSQQGSEEGKELVFGDIEDFFESLVETLRGVDQGLPQPEILAVDEGAGAGLDTPMCSVGNSGSSGRSHDMFIQSIKRTNLRRVIVRSIIKCRTNETTLEVSRAIGSSITKNRHSGASSFVAVVPHQCAIPHVHVWHDCNTIQGMCRCRLFTPFREGDNEKGILATRRTVPGYRPLRSKPSEEARKDGDPYFERLLKYYQTFTLFSN